MKFRSLFFTFFSIALTTQAQEAKYWVFFTDKGPNVAEQLATPSDFLSEKSIERRRLQHISIDETDLPVAVSYKESLEKAGYPIQTESKWLNAVTVLLTEEEQRTVAAYPFVQSLRPVRKMQNITNAYEHDTEKAVLGDESYYGLGYNQIAMVKGDVLHDLGYKGEGMTIAVLDAGFLSANTINAFSSLYDNGQVLGTKDVVNPDVDEVQYNSSSHGTSVLAVMAANEPGLMVGTAPEASYWLIRTEDSDSETLVEEDYWVVGAEFADEVGADIINSSLGYTVFDEGIGDHSYLDMDGNTTVITIGADMAAEKGILVVNSVGNSGNSDWTFLGAPADGDSVLAVGAVDPDGISAIFSSHGPSADLRVKPNVSAQGQNTIVVGETGEYFASNGTSFSAPLIAGMTACLWQYWKEIDPEITNMDIIRMLEERSHLFPYSNGDLGYGIPNYEKALWQLDISEQHDDTFVVSPNPVHSNTIHIRFETASSLGSIRLKNTWGMLVKETKLTTKEMDWRLPEGLSKGMYLLEYDNGQEVKVIKLIKAYE